MWSPLDGATDGRAATPGRPYIPDDYNRARIFSISTDVYSGGS
jgi:hypothetical protein